MNWQPIESAPKDGTGLLVCWDCTPNPDADFPFDGYALATWNAEDEEWNDDGGGSLFADPTHWMPLPEPPK